MAGANGFRSVHPEDDLVREPVRDEVHDEREHEADDEAVGAAEHSPNEQDAVRSSRRAAEPSSPRWHGCILASTTFRRRVRRFPRFRASYTFPVIGMLAVLVAVEALGSPCSRPCRGHSPDRRALAAVEAAVGCATGCPGCATGRACTSRRTEKAPLHEADARRPGLPRRAVPHVLRRRSRSAVLPLRLDGVVRRSRDVLPGPVEAARRPGLRRARPRTSSRSAGSAKTRWRFRRV